ncbi:hypothetical protein HDU98_002960 [Podochytrium sp. JEL0797]|nr:hypothetical protein HDU98_002960 [Podochytrium sp. JEL0797]
MFGQPQQQQQTSGFGGFGASTASTGFGQAAATPGGGLFGQQQQQQQPTSTGFGQTTQQQGGLFGQAPGAATGFGQAAAATPGGGLFGASTQPQQQGGLFGAQQQQQQQQQQPAQQQGLFGQTTTTTQPKATQGFGGFGGFGATQQQQQQPMMQQSMMQQQQQQIQQQQRPATVQDKIKTIQSYWDPNSPNCQFKHYFYNMVHPNEVHLYKCPPNHDPILYNQAVQDNPDPTCMVPVLAVGFEDLKKRIAHQDKMSELHKAKLEELANWTNTIERKHHLDTVIKLEEYKRRHVELSQRVLSMMRTVEILRNKNYPIRSEEESLRARLDAMSSQLQKPAHFRGRVQELEAALRMLKDAQGRGDVVGSVGGGKRGGGAGEEDGEEMEGVEAGGMTEEQVKLISEALLTAHQGLKNLTEVVEEDKKDLEIMNRGFTENIYRRV